MSDSSPLLEQAVSDVSCFAIAKQPSLDKNFSFERFFVDIEISD